MNNDVLAGTIFFAAIITISILEKIKLGQELQPEYQRWGRYIVPLVPIVLGAGLVFIVIPVGVGKFWLFLCGGFFTGFVTHFIAHKKMEGRDLKIKSQAMEIDDILNRRIP